MVTLFQTHSHRLNLSRTIRQPPPYQHSYPTPISVPRPPILHTLAHSLTTELTMPTDATTPVSKSPSAPVPKDPLHGRLRYMSSALRSSLLRNGLVYLSRDTTGNDDGMHGLDPTLVPVKAIDARSLPISSQATLDTHAFALVSHPFPTALATAIGDASSTHNPDRFLLDGSLVAKSYYSECEAVVKNSMPGATSVHAFDHNIRTSDKTMREKYPNILQSALPLVHADYTFTSAPERLQQLTKPALANDTYRLRHEDDRPLINALQKESCKRFAIVNVWRNLSKEPVEKMPLAMCDARSVDPNDFVVFEIRYSDRIGENYLVKCDNVEKHQWCVFPKMTRDEVILLKTWDSEGDVAKSGGETGDEEKATFAFHSALGGGEDEENTQEGQVDKKSNVPERWSMEVRCMVLFQ